MSSEKKLERPVRKDCQKRMFPDDPEFDPPDEWWGMPSFEMGDARPQYRITMNFLTAADVKAFAEKTGLPVTTRSDTAWFPHQEPLRGEFFYDGPKTDSRYPICIPSKGRADIQKTGTVLKRMGVNFKFFVEETEYDAYCQTIGEQSVVKMPFHDLGQGSIPARNFIWEWAKEREHKRHWCIDDNIREFTRMNNNRRLSVRGGGFFKAMEDFVDRYENIVLAGPHDQGFVKDRGEVTRPYLLNSRVYSCILIDTSISQRWRGRYNEDTDLTLRVLKEGKCTLLFNSLLMDKVPTVGVRGKTALKGGNTDTVYKEDDNRRAFAESLRDQHPDVVEVVWKFNRWHHQVDYSLFRNNKPVLKAGIIPIPATNEYGMELVRKSG